MKKKIGIIIGMSLTAIFLTGCDGTVTRDLRHDGFNLSNNEFECSALMPIGDSTEPNDKIVYMSSTYAITENGKLYDISLSQSYSNEQNCKQISFDQDIVAYMDSSILKGKDNKFYYAPGTTNTTPLTEVTSNDSNYQLYALLL